MKSKQWLSFFHSKSPIEAFSVQENEDNTDTSAELTKKTLILFT